MRPSGFPCDSLSCVGFRSEIWKLKRRKVVRMVHDLKQLGKLKQQDFLLLPSESEKTYLRFLYCTRHSRIASCTYLICNATTNILFIMYIHIRRQGPYLVAGQTETMEFTAARISPFANTKQDNNKNITKINMRQVVESSWPTQN